MVPILFLRSQLCPSFILFGCFTPEKTETSLPHMLGGRTTPCISYKHYTVSNIRMRCRDIKRTHLYRTTTLMMILIKMARRSETLNSPRQGAKLPLRYLSNHDYARYTAGSLSISTSEALTKDSVSYPSVVPVLMFATSVLINLYTAVRLRSAVVRTSE